MPFADNLERIAYDLRMRWAARDPVSKDIAVILIDDATLEMFRGRDDSKEMWWPFRRGVYQVVFEYLANSGARAVVFDVDFVERMRDGDEDIDAFARALADFPETPAVLAVALREDGQSSSWHPKT